MSQQIYEKKNKLFDSAVCEVSSTFSVHRSNSEIEYAIYWQRRAAQRCVMPRRRRTAPLRCEQAV